MEIINTLTMEDIFWRILFVAFFTLVVYVSLIPKQKNYPLKQPLAGSKDYKLPKEKIIAEGELIQIIIGNIYRSLSSYIVRNPNAISRHAVKYFNGTKEECKKRGFEKFDVVLIIHDEQVFLEGLFNHMRAYRHYLDLNVSAYDYEQGIRYYTEGRKEFAFVSRHDKLIDIHDFIDLDALERNISNAILIQISNNGKD
jgi:hypothetical protein